MAGLHQVRFGDESYGSGCGPGDLELCPTTPQLFDSYAQDSSLYALYQLTASPLNSSDYRIQPTTADYIGFTPNFNNSPNTIFEQMNSRTNYMQPMGTSTSSMDSESLETNATFVQDHPTGYESSSAQQTVILQSDIESIARTLQVKHPRSRTSDMRANRVSRKQKQSNRSNSSRATESSSRRRYPQCDDQPFDQIENRRYVEN
jgi:hypothetical protein